MVLEVVEGDFKVKDEFVRKSEIQEKTVQLPCKVGDTVWTNISVQGSYLQNKNKPYCAKVVFIGLNNSEFMGGGFFNIMCANRTYVMQFTFSDIGKTVFLSKEDAISALKEEKE